MMNMCLQHPEDRLIRVLYRQCCLLDIDLVACLVARSVVELLVVPVQLTSGFPVMAMLVIHASIYTMFINWLEIKYQIC